MSDCLVIIPTYNEKENIERIIRKVFSLDRKIDVLIIDDNSPDGTATIVKSLMPEFSSRLFMEQRTGKLGLGTAYIHGFRWALQHDYQYIFEMDADFSHNPDDLLKLYDAARYHGGELVIGSRYITGVNVVNWPMGRVLMSYVASIYVRFITRMKVMDTTAGFICYTRKVLETINLSKVRFTGYAFQIEMKYTAWKLGFKIVEVPIIFTDRTMGESKMSKGIFREAVLGVISLRWRSFFRNYKSASG
ncbi:MAG: polyprenol monophosphomannose synthase [Bacteroidota bacterium]